MGTPHVRCLEMHQSLRPSVMDVILFSPDSGIHLTRLIASNAVCLNPSTDANHWSVARVMVGFLVRQS